MENKNEFVIYDSQMELSYEEYVDYCETNEIEPHEDCSSEYYSWVSSMRQEYGEDLMQNIAWSKIDYPLLITGTLGLWDGRHEIYSVPVKSSGYGKMYSTGYRGYDVPSIKEAIEKCIRNSDILDYEVRYENGVIIVIAKHHDGVNRFEIHKLSQKGVRGMQAAENRGEYCYPKDWWFAKIKLDEIDF